MAPGLSLLAAAALALALLPSVQADAASDPLNPAPHDCAGPLDYECLFWSCSSPDMFRGCPYGCPGSQDCVQVTCGLYVETPTLLACFHNGFVPFVRCMAGQPRAACVDFLLRE